MGGSDGTGADSPSPDFALRECTAQAVDIGGVDDIGLNAGGIELGRVDAAGRNPVSGNRTGRNLRGIDTAGIYADAGDIGASLTIDTDTLRNTSDNRGGKFCIRVRGIGPEQTQQTIVLAYARNADQSIRGAQVCDRIVGAATALESRIQRGVDTDGVIRGQNHNLVRCKGIQVGSQRIAVRIAAVHVISLVGKDGKSVPVDDQKIQSSACAVEYGLAI